jgi:hypothetical protein
MEQQSPASTRALDVDTSSRYGLEARMSNARRSRQMPGAAPTHVIEASLTPGRESVHDRLPPVLRSARGQRSSIGKSTMQKQLVAHWMGRGSQRFTQVTAIAVETTGWWSPGAKGQSSPSRSASPHAVPTACQPLQPRCRARHADRGHEGFDSDACHL